MKKGFLSARIGKKFNRIRSRNLYRKKLRYTFRDQDKDFENLGVKIMQKSGGLNPQI